MRSSRWLLWVGLRLCVGPLAAREPEDGGMAMVRCHPLVWRRPEPPGHDHGYCRLLERSANLGRAACTCPAPLPPPALAVGKARGRSGRGLGGGRSLVLEVHRIELNDALGNPRGTFR